MTDPLDTSFRPYCDQCGTRFESGQLRPQSKFCNYCGNELSDWIKRRVLPGSVTTIAPSTPPITPASQAQILETPKRNEEAEAKVTESVRGRGRGGNTRDRGRGMGRGRGEGRDRGRGRRGTQGEEGPAHASQTRNDDETNLGRTRGCRASGRPDYSVENYYRVAFGSAQGRPMNVIPSNVWRLMVSLATNVDGLKLRHSEVRTWYSILVRLTDNSAMKLPLLLMRRLLNGVIR